MTDRFMKQHARPAGAEHDRHRTGGRVDRVEREQRSANRFPYPEFDTGFARCVDQLRIGDTTTATGTASLAAAISLCYDGDVETHEGTHVRRQGTVGCKHQHHVMHSGKACTHLSDRGIKTASKPVDPLQKCRLLGIVDARERVGSGVKRRRVGALQRESPRTFSAAARDLACCAGRLQ